ncbi:MAG: hypothetical protein U0R79_01085 [Propionicimonas sp.]
MPPTTRSTMLALLFASLVLALGTVTTPAGAAMGLERPNVSSSLLP